MALVRLKRALRHVHNGFGGRMPPSDAALDGGSRVGDGAVGLGLGVACGGDEGLAGPPGDGGDAGLGAEPDPAGCGNAQEGISRLVSRGPPYDFEVPTGIPFAILRFSTEIVQPS